MEQATFPVCCVAVGWVCYKWGFAEGIIATSGELTDQDKGEAPDAK